MDYRVLPIPSLPRTQALTSTSFKVPPLDGSLTLPELYDWHLDASPTHPVFQYADASNNVHTIRWSEVVRAVHTAGRLFQTFVSSGKGMSCSYDSQPVISIVASSDTIPYQTVVTGVMRAGYIVFPISVRNSPAAVAHLLKSSKTTHVLVGRDKPSQSLVDEALAMLSEEHPKKIPMPTFQELYLPGEREDFKRLSPVKPDLSSVGMILHSSGSTAFPKLIRWTHYGLLQMAINPYFGERDITGLRLACHSIPMFHGMGVMLQTWVVTSGLVLACFEPSIPPRVPNPNATLKAITESRADAVICAPSFLEAWSRDPSSVQILRALEGVFWGGGPVDKAVGDLLASQGVVLWTSYGCTECSLLNSPFPKAVDCDWEYFEMSAAVNSHFIPDGEGHYEFIILPSRYMVPHVFNTSVNGVPAYNTGDLLVPHPHKRNFYKIFGRADDQIMHSNGEKTNPIPLEKILNQSPDIRCAVMFGRGRFNAGVIVEPADALHVDQSDLEGLAKFRQKIWPFVEKMNRHAPQQSRIFKEMILVSNPSKPFSYTSKLAPRRQTIIEDYAEEIDKLYRGIEGAGQRDSAISSNWSSLHALQFVRSIVTTILHKGIADDDDLFQHGCDSLQAMWIRSTLLNALRNSSAVDLQNVSVNFIYDNPTIEALAASVAQLFTSSVGSSEADSMSEKVMQMEAMVAKYTSDFPCHRGSESVAQPSGKVVLLTGTTGGLGSVLLAKLLASPTVARVYALNRKTGRSAEERQKEAFKLRALDAHLLTSPKLTTLEADFAEHGLGIDANVYEELTASMTHIIHSAYSINFNTSLATLEPNVKGLRNLVNLALSSRLKSPPHFLFTSSIAVVRNCAEDGPVSERLVDTSSALGIGYSESKWVCEQILAAASQKTTLKTTVVRLGQLAGVSTNGYWNPNEWVPTLVKASVYAGCLPDVNSTISWLPVDVAAASILEMCDSEHPVLHLAHPKPITWLSLVGSLSKALNLPVMPYAQWLAKLDMVNTADQAAEEEANPALRLQKFFQSVAPVADGASARESLGMKPLSLELALQVSSTLRECQPLTAEEVERWLKSWKLV